MKTHPILFSSAMVQALLADRKVQTRRIIKRPLKHPGWTGYMTTYAKDGAIECGPDYPDGDDDFVKCPYGKPGDLLWVRETFTRNGFKVGEKVFYRADGESQFMGQMRESNGNITRYHTDHWERNGEKKPGSDWKPSIHMPRWASRLTLEINEVRVQRLQDCSEEDAVAEGIEFCKTGDQYEGDLTYRFKDYLCKGITADDDGVPIHYNNIFDDDPISSYKSLWTSINGPGSWDANPWIWALAFRVHKQNVDEFLKARAA